MENAPSCFSKNSIEECLSRAKAGKLPLLVYLRGTNELTQVVDAIFNEQDVSDAVQSKMVSIALLFDSVGAKQFSQIYFTPGVPCVYVISPNGQPLFSRVGPFASSFFLSELETWLIKCREEQVHVSPSPPSPPSLPRSCSTEEKEKEDEGMVDDDQMSYEAEKDEEKDDDEREPEVGMDGVDEAENDEGEDFETRNIKFHEKVAAVKKKREMKEKQEEKERELRRREEGKERREAQRKIREAQRQEALEKRKKERQRKKEERERLKRLLEEDRMERQAELGEIDLHRTSIGAGSSSGGGEGEFQSDAAGSPHRGASSSSSSGSCATKSSSSGVRRSSALRFRFPDGSSLKHVFEGSDVLGTVVAFLDMDERVAPGRYALAQAYPKRTFSKEDMGSTLQELGFVPSGSLLVMMSEGSRGERGGYGIEAASTDRSIIGQGFDWIRSTGSRAWSRFSGLFSSSSDPRSGSESLWECQPRSESVGALRSQGRQTSPPSTHGRSHRTSAESHAGRVGRISDMPPDGDRPAPPDHESYWNGNSTEFEG